MLFQEYYREKKQFLLLLSAILFDAKMKKQALPLNFLAALKSNIWLLGTFSWLFLIANRTIDLLKDGTISAIDLTQLLTALLFFVSWLYLKPEKERPRP